MAENSNNVTTEEATVIFSVDKTKLHKLTTGMSLLEIFKIIKKKNVEITMDKSNENNSDSKTLCFICLFKEQILKDLWTKLPANYKTTLTPRMESTVFGNSDEDSNKIVRTKLLHHDFQDSSVHSIDNQQLEADLSNGFSESEEKTLQNKIKHLFVNVAENLLAFNDDCSDHVQDWEPQADDDMPVFLASTNLSRDYVESHEVLSKYCKYSHSDNLQDKVVGFKVCKKCMDAISFVSERTDEDQLSKSANAVDLLNHVITMLYVCASECDETDHDDDDVDRSDVENCVADINKNDASEFVQKQTEKLDGKFVTVQIAADTDEYDNEHVVSDLLSSVAQQPIEIAVNGGACAEFVSNGLQHKNLVHKELDFHTNVMVCPSGIENGEMDVVNGTDSKTISKSSPTTYKQILLRTHKALKALQTDNTIMPNGGSFRWVKSVNVTKVKPDDLNTKSPSPIATNGVVEDKLPNHVPSSKEKLNGLSDIPGVSPFEDNVPRAAKSKCKEIIDLFVKTNELASEAALSCSPSKQGKSRTPSKKKSDRSKSGSSMKRIVWGYLTSPTEFGSARSPPPPRNKGRRSRSTKLNSPRKKAIPIPYETHYLCITRTIAKKGWKAYWYRKCRCAKSRRSSNLTETETSPTCSYSGSPVHTPEEISVNDSATESNDPLVDFEHEPSDAKCSSPNGIEVVITSNTTAAMHDEQPECSEVKFGTDITPLNINEGLATSEQHKKLKLPIVKTESGLSDEIPQMGSEVRVSPVNTFSENFVPRVARDEKEVASRREKLKDVLSALKKIRNLRNQETCDLLLKPVVFAQSHEPVDKQPSSLDLVSVNRVVIASCVDSNLVNLGDIFTKQSAHAASLLEGAGLSAFARSRNARSEGDPYFASVWDYGKLPKFFEEVRVVKPLKRLKLLKSGYRAAKPNVLGMHRLKSLKRAMLHKKPKQTQIQRIKPLRIEIEPVANKDFNQKMEPDLWQVPKQSVSAVVGGLEYLWGEILQNPLPKVPMITSTNESKPYGAIVMCNKQVEHALGALCKDDDIFTFSSKRLTTGKGQKNVLLISRKYVPEPRPRRRRYRKDSINGECPCMQMKPFTFDAEIDTPRAESPNKILLKLKKVQNDESMLYKTDNENEDTATDANGPKPIVDEGGARKLQVEVQNTEQISADLEELKNPDVESQDDNPSTSTFLPTKPKHLEDQLQSTTDNAITEENNSDSNVISAAEQMDLSTQTTSQLGLESFSKVAHGVQSSDEWVTPPSSPLYLGGSKSQIATPSTFLRKTGLDTSTPHANAPDKQAGKLGSPISNEISSEQTEGGLHNDELHQFLSKLNENSLDLLESVLMWCEPDQLPPLQLFMSLHDVHNDTTEEDRARMMTSISPSCHSRCENLLSFGSPEVIRGITHSKGSPKPAAAAASMSPNESGADFRGSPVSPGCMGNTDNSNNLGRLTVQHNGSALLKPCNVVLEPITSLCKDMENGVGSTKSTATSYHRRLYEKILKNHALNGAYWKNTSSLPGVQDTARLLRDRVKRKRSSSDEKMEEESSEESSEDSDDESSVQVPSGPKRKRLGNVEYTRVNNQSINEVVNQLWKNQSGTEPTHTKNQDHTQGGVTEQYKFFHLLMSQHFDLTQVMSWMLNTTATNPRPLLSPYLVAKRNRIRVALEKSRTKSRSRRASSVVSTTSSVTSCNDDLKVGRKRSFGQALRKKSKDFLTPSKTNRCKSITDEQFEALRKQLFYLRHPDYKGKLHTNGNQAVVTITPTELVVRSTSLQLHHINEDEARKSATPFLNKRVIMNGNSSNDIVVPSKRRRMFAPCRTPPHDNQPDDVTPFSQSLVESESLDDDASEWQESPQPMNSPPLVQRRRGRGRGRGRPRRILSSSAPHLQRGKLFSSSRGRGRGSRGRGASRMAKLVVGHHSEQSEHERGPRLNSRFANKHSTEGSFLQRILESGNFEKYV
uniref:Uncharacterized protein LOC100181464 n=1 Tax=Phallusia mammillata TaxID=59560 RepID=A0A6F9DGW4_9ASCI|nr:uncharacterized protein LOC100181464 [Phallusia mammillata]